MTAPARFRIELAARPGVDATRALRRGLKYLGRACGFRAVSVTETGRRGLAEEFRLDL